MFLLIEIGLVLSVARGIRLKSVDSGAGQRKPYGSGQRRRDRTVLQLSDTCGPVPA